MSVILSRNEKVSLISKVLFLLLLISTLINLILGFAFYTTISEYEERINKLINEYNKLAEENKKLKSQLVLLKNTLESLNIQTLPQMETITLEEFDWIPIVGIFVKSRSFFEEELKGIVMKVFIKITPGSGRIFISTNPKIGINLQRTAEIAYKVAMKFTKSKMNYDVIIVIVANTTIDIVDGPSAGAALSILLTSLLWNKTIRKDVIITGTIREDGSIGPVGGIYEKAIAAAEYGAKIFLVPKGQSTVTILVPETIKITPNFKIIRYKPKRVKLEEELERKGYNMKVYEVSTMKEALKFFLKHTP